MGFQSEEYVSIVIYFSLMFSKYFLRSRYIHIIFAIIRIIGGL